MIQELAQERRARRVGRIVPVFHAERRVGDQRLRSRRQIVVGVHDPSRLAELEQGCSYGVCCLRELGEIEHAPETIGRRGVFSVSFGAGDRTKGKKHNNHTADSVT
jgi:hypothetical protein